MDESWKISIESGDLILFSRPCIAMDMFPSLICFAAKASGMTDFDHVGIVVESDDKTLYLLEANMGGITMHPLINRLQRSKAPVIAVRKFICVGSKQVRKDNAKKLWEVALQLKGLPYNSSFLDMSKSLWSSYTHHSTLNTVDTSIQHYLEAELQKRQQSVNSSLVISSLIRNRLFKFANGKTDKKDDKKIYADTAAKKSFYCSQLVAEVLMHCDMIEKSKSSSLYIPADFSSNTIISCITAKPHFLTTPDLVIRRPREARIWQNCDGSLVISEGTKTKSDFDSSDKRNGIIDSGPGAVSKDIVLNFAKYDVLPYSLAVQLLGKEARSMLVSPLSGYYACPNMLLQCGSKNEPPKLDILSTTFTDAKPAVLLQKSDNKTIDRPIDRPLVHVGSLEGIIEHSQIASFKSMSAGSHDHIYFRSNRRLSLCASARLASAKSPKLPTVTNDEIAPKNTINNRSATNDTPKKHEGSSNDGRIGSVIFGSTRICADVETIIRDFMTLLIPNVIEFLSEGYNGFGKENSVMTIITLQPGQQLPQRLLRDNIVLLTKGSGIDCKRRIESIGHPTLIDPGQLAGQAGKTTKIANYTSISSFTAETECIFLVLNREHLVLSGATVSPRVWTEIFAGLKDRLDSSECIRLNHLLSIVSATAEEDSNTIKDDNMYYDIATLADILAFDPKYSSTEMTPSPFSSSLSSNVSTSPEGDGGIERRVPGSIEIEGRKGARDERLQRALVHLPLLCFTEYLISMSLRSTENANVDSSSVFNCLRGIIDDDAYSRLVEFHSKLTLIKKESIDDKSSIGASQSTQMGFNQGLVGVLTGGMAVNLMHTFAIWFTKTYRQSCSNWNHTSYSSNNYNYYHHNCSDSYCSTTNVYMLTKSKNKYKVLATNSYQGYPKTQLQCLEHSKVLQKETKNEFHAFQHLFCKVHVKIHVKIEAMRDSSNNTPVNKFS